MGKRELRKRFPFFVGIHGAICMTIQGITKGDALIHISLKVVVQTNFSSVFYSVGNLTTIIIVILLTAFLKIHLR